METGASNVESFALYLGMLDADFTVVDRPNSSPAFANSPNANGRATQIGEGGLAASHRSRPACCVVIESFAAARPCRTGRPAGAD